MARHAFPFTFFLPHRLHLLNSEGPHETSNQGAVGSGSGSSSQAHLLNLSPRSPRLQLSSEPTAAPGRLTSLPQCF